MIMIRPSIEIELAEDFFRKMRIKDLNGARQAFKEYVSYTESLKKDGVAPVWYIEQDVLKWYKRIGDLDG